MVPFLGAVKMPRAKTDLPSPLPDANSEWLTTIEVAGVLRVHPKHVYRLLHQGMPARRVGGQWRFSRDAIMQWADHRVGSLGSDTAPPDTVSAASLAALVAVEPNELCDTVISTVAASPRARVAVMHAGQRRSLDLLAAGEVAAAVVRHHDALETACATVRITLGARQLGIATGTGSTAPPEIVAIPPEPPEGSGQLADWLEAARQRGARLDPAEYSE